MGDLWDITNGGFVKFLIGGFVGFPQWWICDFPNEGFAGFPQ
jgi:hypothetical protein